MKYRRKLWRRCRACERRFRGGNRELWRRRFCSLKCCHAYEVREALVSADGVDSDGPKVPIVINWVTMRWP